MGAGAAIFIWAAIILHLAFGPIVVGVYALIARPNVDRKWLFWVAGVGAVIGLRTITQAVVGLLMLRVPAARDHAILVLGLEMLAAIALAVPVLGALARGLAPRAPPRARGRAV